MVRRCALATTLLALMLGASACAGKTIVLDSPNTSDAGHSSGPSAGSPAPKEHPRPSDPPSASEQPSPEEPNQDQSGWWPPAPSPTPTPSPSESGSVSEQDPSQSPSETTPPKAEPSDEPDDGEENPGPDRFTFPGWEEHIYESRNGEGPAMFKNRDRFKESCGDFASEAGADLLSPDAAECLDQGRTGEGKESAIAVRMSQDEVHVWFIRVGPKQSEYFVDRSAAGGPWVYASCDSSESIAVLNCSEPTPVKESEANDDDPSPSPDPDPSPSQTPDPSPSSTHDDPTPPAEDDPKKPKDP